MRPVFRAADWEHYRAVNQRFAEAVVQEARTDEPDRAGAGLPLRAAAADDPRAPARRRPSSPSGTSPGPTRRPSASAPGATSCSRACWAPRSSASTPSSTATTSSTPWTATLEARVDRETFTHLTSAASRPRCAAIPISIEWPPAPLAAQPPVPECRAARARGARPAAPTCGSASASTGSTTPRASSSASPRSSGCSSSSRDWIGRFAFVQIAAPSRSSIEEYQSLRGRGCALPPTRINGRFGSPGYQPIVLKIEHHDAGAGLRPTTAPPTCASSRACTTA